MLLPNASASPTGANPTYPASKPFLSAVLALVTACCALTPGCTKPEVKKSDSAQSTASAQQPPFEFTDITDKLALKHTFSNGEESGERSILETIGGGVAALDYDLDGFDDLYFATGGKLNDKQVTGLGGALYRNQQASRLLDVSALAGVSTVQFYTHGTIAGDVNNDGFPDLLVTGYDGLALLINQGDGTFSHQTTTAGLVNPKWGTSAAFGDFNSDGSLDIYIARHVDWSFQNHPDCTSAGKPDVCAPGIFSAIKDAIYLNNGDGTFTESAEQMGLAEGGKGLGVIVADFDQDSRVDIYVANDTTNNFYYLNKGQQLEEIGLASGTAVDDMGTPQGSMGLCVLDYDGDLKTDIMVSNYENQAFALYKNDGESNFRYATSTTGLMALGTTYVAWGTSASDFDLDGDEDVIVANGHVMMSNPPEQQPLFLRNMNNSKFLRQTFNAESYFGKSWRGRGVVALDFDHDGDLDLVITHINQPAVVLQNQTQATGNWWKLRLIGRQSNRSAVGARVVIESDKRKILRNVFGGGSYLSQSPYEIHWGLPKDERISSLTIHWPSGTIQKLPELPHNNVLTVVEDVN